MQRSEDFPKCIWKYAPDNVVVYPDSVGMMWTGHESFWVVLSIRSLAEWKHGDFPN